MDSLSSPTNGIHLPNNRYRNDTQGDRTSWEYHTVSVTRVTGYGFGIAVSGGRDNVNFLTGDPAIAVSDVLKGGPAEEKLLENDRIISVNGVSLENVDYATAVQVLRDSGNTVTLVIKRRVTNLGLLTNATTGPSLNSSTTHNHQHSNSLVSSTGLSGNIGNNSSSQAIKLVLTKPNKKEDFGIVLGCRLFVKEISTKARDQLVANGYTLQEGDIVTRIHNTNTNDAMSLKEARKIIDSCKERLNLVVLRDLNAPTVAPNNSINNNSTYSHAAQVSSCSNPEETFYNGNTSGYSTQNLYVQPPTRPAVASPLSTNSNASPDDKNNLTPRGRSRGPIVDGPMMQLDKPNSPQVLHSRNRSISGDNTSEDFYSSRRQLYQEDPLQRTKQPSEPRFISFQKEGSVGIRLTGGNEAGIFVTAVQPGSAASMQGLTPGDKILKVNDMDMAGVTREEAVLFLLSLQEQIDLIVQHCKEEYDNVVSNQRGDSFHIKTHFHCDTPAKGEMAFKAGDVFRVVDTLHNGVVGSWQVLRIGRGHQEMQRGVIPNKSRAEELATAQFNASKKEMNASESRTSFFRRRRSSSHRRSKSLSRENWDDVVFSDSISKFPAYEERVVLKHPGFVRPVVLFGPVSDIARERLIKDFPDKFTAPLQSDDKSSSGKSGIIRLSNIRDIMDRGKHALLDITPNAVDRLNYAQFYPIVIFLKADTKHTIKQLRQGLPKSAHKSSKKLFEQCQKLDRIWSHVFSNTIALTDADTWYRKLRDSIDQMQSGAVWMSSENKPLESLSDDFLFPMNTSRLSYASSPESDIEMSSGPTNSLSMGNLPQLVKASSDPSIATNQENLERDVELNNLGDGLMPPPYTNPYDHNLRRSTIDNKFNFSGTEELTTEAVATHDNALLANSRESTLLMGNAPDLPPRIDRASKPPSNMTPSSTLLITASARNSMGLNSSSSRNGTYGRSAHEQLFGDTNSPLTTTLADVAPVYEDEYSTRINAPTDKRGSLNASSLDRKQGNQLLDKSHRSSSNSTTPANGKTNGSSYDSVSSYDSCNVAMQNLRLGPNAPDDLKSVPTVATRNVLPLSNETPVTSPRHSIHHSDSMNSRSPHDHTRNLSTTNDLNKQNSPARQLYSDTRNLGADPRSLSAERRPGNIPLPHRPMNLGLDMAPPRKLPQPLLETKTDYGKYSRNHSISQADYDRTPKSPLQHHHSSAQNGNMPFKPVPPPKPKNYRPMIPSNGNATNGNMPPNQWDATEGSRNQNGYYYPPTQSHYHQQSQQPHLPQPPMQPNHGPPIHAYNHSSYPYGSMSSANGNGHYASQPMQQPQSPYMGVNNLPGSGYNKGQYNAGHMQRAPIYDGNMQPPSHQSLDLAGSREQRGSAFELYRKPQLGNMPMHHHNVREWQHEQQQPYPPQQYQYPYGRYPMEDGYGPPKLPPKSFKKKYIKAPLAAIKNALLKSKKQLQRQGSMSERDSSPKMGSGLRRQHSMIEQRTSGRWRTPSEFEYQQQQPYYDQRQRAYDDQYYDERRSYMNHSQLYGDDYENKQGNYYEQENLYANRALIEFERKASENRMPYSTNTGTRIVRRHSMADRTSRANARYPVQRPGQPSLDSPDDRIEREEIYQTRSGAFMMQQTNLPSNNRGQPMNAAVRMQQQTRDDDAIYQHRREMHLDHLYQSKREMQQRIHQGRVEVERTAHSESPSSSSTATTPVHSDHMSSPSRDVIYQSRRELKEKGFKTRTQLRDRIYQSRQEAMESMAEPVYSKRVEIQRHQEPIIYEGRESEHMDRTPEEIDRSVQSLPQNNSMNVTPKDPHIQRVANALIAPMIANQNSCNSSGLDDDDTVNSSNQSSLQKTVISPESMQSEEKTIQDDSKPTEKDVESQPAKPFVPRADPTHISNVMRRVAPMAKDPQASTSDGVSSHENVLASRTSIETQYTSSQISLPTGPPVAQSTPYASAVVLENDTFYPPIREQSTTHGIFDENGGTLCDDVWNVSIDIPKGAIPPGVKQEIYFTVTDPRMSQSVGGPPLDMENGETMLSPLVMCGPQALEFLVPVTLNIPHYASKTASLGLSLKATDSEKNLQTNWDNIELPSNTAAHTVSVKVDHF
ncbi:tight junction protein ZO-1 isoform X4 [Sitodiplosis mosellana]|uniref:tight junction protein ZO-1 isoform X4 n=2 Tax=Sitodiplosis mosellana TaxID=263140 RepID=UPI00244450C0|nr:tight junction protein ZO-1 isoform X4 [Sitodiplosis mosellana]XP_055316294.1 tight junction protein ZO-1 isoform X4 [Sitodiplosis mosellana]XP_055316304.1 tight junction protein ZO-1 isoform X4 [Sitodiplosis mosellana]XP_055316313.1 tight junction protein ZO-1 isoform X4 [Sitodiplosis mosellana]XP_055316322.1 tight junction protein ZO-1 isoform X4 [Sitodiplosis mosellana]